MTDPRHGGDDLGETLPADVRSSNRGRYATLVLIAVVVIGALVVRRLNGETDHRATSHRSTTATRPSVPHPSGTVGDDRRFVRYPPLVVVHVEKQICARCRSSRDPGLAKSASRALGPTRDLIARSVGDQGLVVAALFADGAALTAVLTAHRHAIVPTRLGIRPPIGVQTQRNGRDTLVVIVSGRTDAVALLGRPAVQRGLATLRLP